MNDHDRPLFLVVTIKPRLDRLEEAEAQLQSMEAVAQTTGGREISNRSPGERIRGAADGCIKRKNEAEVRRRCGKAQHTGGEPALCNSLHAANTLTEPGCVFMHLLQPHDDPETWVMVEKFRSRAAWDEHMQQPYNTEGNKILEDLLREPSDLRLFDEK